MKSKKILLLACLSLGIGFGANSQIQNATQPVVGIGGPTNNTGLAIAPNLSVHASVHDDGFGNYHINWIEPSTSAVVDTDVQPGNDPDVAYYGNEDALMVGYENGGNVFLDFYYLVSISPTDYNFGGTTPVSSGQYPNIDMNSNGDGVMCWEDGGMVWACSFAVGGSPVGPPVPINAGMQPDVILLDDGITVALTYVEPGGSLMIETMDYWDLTVGGYSLWNQWNYPAMSMFQYPRIAGQRNTAMLPNPPDDFTVVAQDWNGSTDEVYAWFANGGVVTVPGLLVNNDFSPCTTVDPRPVVAYERGRVHIAWSQFYSGGCSGLWQSSPNNEDDILLKTFGPSGTTATFYEEVNTWQTAFASISRPSISTEYDGFSGINNTNWNEGLVFNDPGDLLWKARYNTMPSFIGEADPTAERDGTFSLVTSPVDQTIEVLSESDDFASFQMLDNAGRIVELNTISNDGNVYSIDISHLSGGMYFLHCNSDAGQEVLRVLQVTK